MKTRQTYQALSFATNTARLAGQFGLKSGLKKAATRINPVAMVLDTAFSVLEAADSWLKLKAARARRDGLAATTKTDKRRLEVEREQLAGELEIARKQIALEVDARQHIGRLALLSAQTVQSLMEEMAEARRAALPDLDAFDTISRKMQGAWDQMCLAMEHFQQTTT